MANTTRLMAGPPVLLLAALIASACGTIESGKTLVRSPRYPAIAIECTGDAIVPLDTCLGWGEKMLDGSPEVVPQSSRLILTFRGGNARCAAEFYAANGTLVVTASAVCPTLPDA